MKFVAYAALAAALVSTPALAAEGQLDVSYSRAEPEGSDTVTTTGVSGQVLLPANETWGVQLDGAWTHTEGAANALLGVPSLSGSEFTAHLYARNETGAVAVFAGTRDIKAGFAMTYDYGGLEAQKYFDNVTLDVAIGKGRLGALFANPDVQGAGAALRIFANDDTRFDVRGGWTQMDAGLFAAETDAWNVGLGVEHRLDGPFSLFAAYDYAKAEDAGFESNILTIGVRMNFGSGSLKARDRSGASFDGGKLFARPVDFVF